MYRDTINTSVPKSPIAKSSSRTPMLTCSTLEKHDPFSTLVVAQLCEVFFFFFEVLGNSLPFLQRAKIMKDINQNEMDVNLLSERY